MNLYEAITKNLKEGATWGGHSIEYSLEDIKKNLEDFVQSHIKDLDKYRDADLSTYYYQEDFLPSQLAALDAIETKYVDRLSASDRDTLDDRSIYELKNELNALVAKGIDTDNMSMEDKEALLTYAIKKTDFDYVYDEGYDEYINRLYSLGQKGWVPGPVEGQLSHLRPDTYWEIGHKAGLNVDEWYSDEEEEEALEDSEAVKEDKNITEYRYITNHGIGPLTTPKGTYIRSEDLDNNKTAIYLNRPLTNEELEYYDIKPEHIQENSETLKEEEEYLEPKFDSAQSFYKKAIIDNGKLYSYGKLVAEFVDGEPLIHDWFSNTTGRHIKEFLKQGGHRADSKKQMMQDYGVKIELEETGEVGTTLLLQQFLEAKNSGEMTKLLTNTKMPQTLLKELQNIAEMYRENLDNEEDDVFKGTQDSYASENLDNSLAYLMDSPELEEYIETTGLGTSDPAKKEKVIDRLIFTFGIIIENEIQGNYTLSDIFKV